MDQVSLNAAENMSPLALFLQADLVVQSVMIGLLLASIVSWAVMFERGRRLRQIERQTASFEDKFWKAKSLDQLKASKGAHPAADMFLAGMDEWDASVESRQGGRGVIDREGVRARLSNVMSAALDRSISDLSDKLNLLATIGSVSPFVGLFGTVWGIMRAFTAIGATQNTSLAVVAPGIAEALFATAIGLFAAIPAVIGYNRLLHRVTRLEDRLLGFQSAFEALLSRELDNVN